jgi:sugar phosphate isomerase/epimerase
MNRREFLASTALAAQAVTRVTHAADAASSTRPTLCFFSKHLPDLSPGDVGRAMRDTGFGGVDLTVRPKGHVLPERAAEDLPKAVEAIRSQGIAVPMITTEIVSASDPNARPILSTAAQLRIPYFKLGYWKWGADPLETIRKVGDDIRGIVALAKEYGITAGMHNHAGNVGLAIWDTREMIRDLDPKYVGYYWDTQHATVEGGDGGWLVSLKIALPRMKMAALKDFTWQKVNGKWKAVSCPLGEGMVDFPKIFAAFAAHRFTGPISIHQEYPASDPVVAARKDREFASRLIDKAYS